MNRVAADCIGMDGAGRLTVAVSHAVAAAATIGRNSGVGLGVAGATIRRRDRITGSWIWSSRVAVEMAADATGTTGVAGGCSPKRHIMASRLKAVTVWVTHHAVAVLMVKITRLRCIGGIVLVSSRLRMADFTDPDRRGMTG